ncbi:MAG: hypothetical protein QM657_15625 [Lacrimispora sp.]|uniref:hypothetical protein n=1 Tax=Lacrimispora sp. TaxID=2719234 RepID=UPI0039E53B66
MTKIEEMIREEGRIQGREEGRMRVKKYFSLRMLKKGFDYEAIAEIQEVSIEQIKAWEDEAFNHI